MYYVYWNSKLGFKWEENIKWKFNIKYFTCTDLFKRCKCKCKINRGHWWAKPCWSHKSQHHLRSSVWEYFGFYTVYCRMTKIRLFASCKKKIQKKKTAASLYSNNKSEESPACCKQLRQHRHQKCAEHCQLYNLSILPTHHHSLPHRPSTWDQKMAITDKIKDKWFSWYERPGAIAWNQSHAKISV